MPHVLLPPCVCEWGSCVVQKDCALSMCGPWLQLLEWLCRADWEPVCCTLLPCRSSPPLQQIYARPGGLHVGRVLFVTPSTSSYSCSVQHPIRYTHTCCVFCCLAISCSSCMCSKLLHGEASCLQQARLCCCPLALILSLTFCGVAVACPAFEIALRPLPLSMGLALATSFKSSVLSSLVAASVLVTQHTVCCCGSKYQS